MGSAASMVDDQRLDKERKERIVRELRVEYERLQSADASAAYTLMQRLHSLLAEALSEPLVQDGSRKDALSAVAKKAAQTGLQKAHPNNLGKAPSDGSSSSSSSRTGRSRAPPTRRRSYGEKETARLTKGTGSPSKSASASLNATQSEPVLSPLPDTVTVEVNSTENLSDHWDSVTQLPYCTVCQMAFKSVSVLDRHIKYSEMHLKAVKKAEGEASSSSSAAAEAEVPVLAPIPIPRQVEGQDYKLLYYGSKFFWRSQENIDFSFFHHIACSIIEVVPFDVYKNKELERLYFELGLIHDRIDEDVEVRLEGLRRQFVLDNKTDKFQSKVFDEAGHRAQLMRQALTNYLLTRLHLQQVMPDKPQTQIAFVESAAAAGDGKTGGTSAGVSIGGSSPLLAAPPSILVPVSVMHRRNTSTEEVKQKLSELASDQAALRASISKAETIAAMVHRFASLYAARKQLMTMSIPRRRWVLAIRKTIQIIATNKTRAMIKAKGPAWSWAMGPVELAQAVQEGTFPPPSSTSPDAALRRRRAGQQVKELAGHL